MDDSTLEQTAERVFGLANTNIAALAAFGVLPADVTTLDTGRAAFTAIKTSPREAAAGRKAQTQSLPQLIGNVRSIFRNEIDKMMTPFKKSNADFYNGYFAARVIMNRAATQKPKPAAPAPKP